MSRITLGSAFSFIVIAAVVCGVNTVHTPSLYFKFETAPWTWSVISISSSFFAHFSLIIIYGFNFSVFSNNFSAASNEIVYFITLY